jgi:multiple antibiotic resistance protein
MQQHLQAVITVLSLVNPAVCAELFAKIERGQSRQEHLKDATQAAVAVLVILILAALIGVQVTDHPATDGRQRLFQTRHFR